MNKQYRVPVELVRERYIQGMIVQCKMEEINHLLNNATITNTNDEVIGTIPLTVDLIIRSDKTDKIVMYDDFSCKATSDVLVEIGGHQGYFALMNNLKNMVTKTLQPHVKVPDFIRNTMMLPMGYYADLNKNKISIVFHLVVDDFHISSDYMGGAKEKCSVVRVCELKEMMYKAHPEEIMYLNSLVTKDF